MRIGIISNSDILIPLTHTLAAQQLQVYLFLSKGPDTFSTLQVLGFARRHRIPVREERSEKTDLYQWINEGKYDACFVLGYSHKILLSKVNVPHETLFNIHFSSLPSYKGPSPVFWQLKDGVKNLGISIHQLTQKLDDGPVVWQKEYPNPDFFNYETAYRFLGDRCIGGVVALLQQIGVHLPLLPVKPSAKTGSYHGRPKAEDVMIDWKKMTALEICNLVRACNPWNKGAITTVKGIVIKLLDAQIIDYSFPHKGIRQAGLIIKIEDSIKINTSDNKTIKTNSLFINNSFIPSYQCHYLGIKEGDTMEEPLVGLS